MRRDAILDYDIGQKFKLSQTLFDKFPELEKEKDRLLTIEGFRNQYLITHVDGEEWYLLPEEIEIIE